MKKWDTSFAALVVIAAGLVTCWYGYLGGQDAGQITITVDQKVFGTYLLSEDQEININDTNYLVIKDNQADMIEADCPDKYCVNQRAISRKGESIVCLPNEVIVEVTGGEDAELDGVAN